LTISILEGISIYQWLADHHLWTQRLKEKLQEHKEITFDLAPEVWLLSVIPCPLLDQGHRCSVYETRPFLCRTVFSRGDSFYCHPHRLGSNFTGILDRSDEVDALWSAEKKTLKRHGLRPIMLPLSAALLLGERIVKGEVELEETNSTLIEEHAQQ
jgi:Fe-S-cluster containining protein